jgi:flavin-dependent dehydrogenase
MLACMDYDYDAIVVGARCAGASTAMLLARAGHKVLLVDRATFPSEIARGHFVHRDGPARLHRWGLLDKIVASGCPATTSMISNFGDFNLLAEDLVENGVAWGYGPRRGALDKILVDAAVNAGAELHEEFSVEDLIVSDGTVTGIRGRAAHKQTTVEVRARLTIGADGLHSGVARVVRPTEYEAVPTLACWYFSYWRGVPDPNFEMHVLMQRRALFTHRTNDDLVAVFVGWPIADFRSVRSNVEAAFYDVLDQTDGFGERVRAGRRVERFYGTGDMPSFMRTPFGPGWALVGDAGCHMDPFLALGVSHALRDAELLANAAHRGLAGERPMHDALRDYEAQRNAAGIAEYRENVHAARFLPMPPEVLQLRRALRAQPQATTRWIKARYGMIPREAFSVDDVLAAAKAA